jgi:predicted PurR-regulated permease PerM
MERIIRIIFFIFLIITGLYFGIFGLMAAKVFLAPIIIAILLSMLVLPVAEKLESLGLQRGWASFGSDLLLVLASLAFVFVLSAQITLVANDWDKISKKLQPKIEEVLDFVEQKTGMDAGNLFTFSPESGQKKNPDGNQKLDNPEKDERQKAAAGQAQNNESSGGINTPFSKKQILSGVASSAASLFSFLGNLLLVFVYVFFFLLYRDKLQKAFLKMVPGGQKDTASEIVKNSVKVAKSYLSGKFLLILFLGIFYSVGMLLLGVKYAVFAGIIAAILSLVPYFGNLIGGSISVLFAFVSGGSLWMIFGVIGIFVVAQFIESYLLEPYIVGKQVELNPIVIIIMVILGEAIWGVTGMVIAIPVIGIFKVIFDAIPFTQPIGYLLGNEDISGGEGMFKKIESKVKSLFGKNG